MTRMVPLWDSFLWISHQSKGMDAVPIVPLLSQIFLLK